MEIIGVIIFFGLPISFVLIGYYLDYKKNKEYFLSGFKGMFKGGLLLALIILLSVLSGRIKKWVFPLNDDYGIEFNSQRLELDIPIIEKGWSEIPAWGHQYRKWYSVSPVSNAVNGHTKKKIEFNWKGAVLEEDYFESEETNTSLFTRYHYDTKRFDYYLIEPIPLKEQLKLDENGKIELFRSTEKEVKITKEQFLEKVKSVLITPI